MINVRFQVTILAWVLVVAGVSGLIQSFRRDDTLEQMIINGFDPSTLNSRLWSIRMFGIACLCGAAYIFWG